MITLTAKQIKELDEINFDKAAAESTLQIALTYHSNRYNAIRKHEKAWWDDMMELYNLDKTKIWMVDRTGPIIHIREKTDEDRD